MSKIDFIVYWVDGSDAEWQKKKKSFMPASGTDNSNNRYRDMGTLKYLFRGIEKFAPWVNKVYFVTDNQKPEWLNTDCSKLVMVDHKDYIPEKYLPTFNANPIELNFHRIEGLSEQFVVFNDDFFITSPMKETDFFVDGKPVDIFTEFPLQYKENVVFNKILFNDFTLASKYYPSRSEYKKRIRNKILTPKYGSYFFYNLLMYMLPYKAIFGISTPHFARPYTRSIFEKVWADEYELMDSVSSHKFRHSDDINIYALRYLNLLSGNFVPSNIYKMGKAYNVTSDDESMYETIRNQKYKLLCINDDCSDEVFEVMKEKSAQALETILPHKSTFEL